MGVPRSPSIYVIAGVNGAGKSSIGGATIRQRGGTYYNPDEAAHALMMANPTLRQADANSAAWQQGVKMLKRAIVDRLTFVFETTLGGYTITHLLAQAASQGIDVHVWHVGLSTPELHIKRVQARVKRGGHDIPDEDIHRRYEHSRLNLIALLYSCSTLRMYDNSAEADPSDGHAPSPKLILHMERGKILGPTDLTPTPDWARPIVAAALKLSQS